MHPDELYYEVQGQPRQTLVRAMDYLNPEALEYERLGALHYTGLIESWSNLYTRFAIAMDAKTRKPSRIWFTRIWSTASTASAG